MASNKRLNATITIGGSLSSSLKFAFTSAKEGLSSIGKEIQALQKRQALLGKSIQTFGRMGKNVDGLRTEYAKLTTQLERAQKAQEKLANSQAKYTSRKEFAHKAAGVGVAAGAAGAVLGAPLVLGTKEAKAYQTEMGRVMQLGMDDDTNKKAFDFAKSMKTYGTSQLENLTLVRDAMSVFGDLHHAEMVAPTLAKMKFGNAAFFGAEKGHENEAKFMDMLKVIELRGGLKSEDEFKNQANMIQRVISATGGRVGPEEWRHMIATGGLAAKSMRDDAFFYQMEPLVQEMGGDRVGTGLMSSYAALYQGRTTKRAANNLEDLGLIADHSKVTEDKAGQIKYLNPGALKGSDLFRQSQFEWMEQVLLPTLAKHGITSKDAILDAIGSINSNRKASDIMAAMYLQRDQIRKNAKLNSGAADIDTLDREGRSMAAGKELDAEAKLADLKLRVGENILPIYSRALEMAANGLDRLNAFTDKHPRLAKYMTVGLVALSAGLVALAPVLITVGGAVTTLAAGMYVASRAAPVFGAALRGAGVALRFVGTSLLWLGRALLMNPIGLTITAIGVAAFVIYKYWTPIKEFFGNLWNRIIDIFTNAKATLTTWWDSLDVMGSATRAFTPVKVFFTGLVDDIVNVWKVGLKWITDKIEWVGQKWKDTKSFFGLGDDGAKPGTLGDAANSPGPELPRLPARTAPGGFTDNSTNTYTITQLPGENGAQLMQRILDEQERRKKVRERAAMPDGGYAQ
ncbi:phage tail tape measure protein [Tardiphaga sp. 20_F10_N6_6]|uniref:phage tail tape measure protein n=1 Tax=Tardiphaga sp. 20_F10_N6_6 TaxID=3240788 RepID=UPI003F8BBBD6